MNELVKRIYLGGSVLLSVAGLILLLQSCAGSGAPGLSGIPGGGDHVDPRNYRAVDLSNMAPAWNRPLSAAHPLLTTGSFSGDGGDQIAIVGDGSPGTITILNLSGSVAQTIHLANEQFGSLMPADINHDGHDDLVLGGADAGSARILAVDGSGRTLVDYHETAMEHAVTEPQFVLNGTIYFTAYSATSLMPREVGALPVGSARAAWLYTPGPIPTGMAYDPDGARFAVSNVAASVDQHRRTTQPAATQAQHELLLLDLHGHPTLSMHIGPPMSSGRIVPGQISGVSEKLMTLNGKPGILTLVSRVSGVYGGNSQLVFTNLAGQQLASFSGPPKTGGNFGFFGTGRTHTIAVAWSRAGKVELLNDSLRAVRSALLPGDAHHASLRAIGSFSGPGSRDLLVTDENRVYVLDERLRTIFSTALSAPVVDAQFAPSQSGNPCLAVLTADALNLFRAGPSPSGTIEAYTSPPGDAVSLDGLPVKPSELPVITEVPPGRHLLSVGSANAKTVTVDVRPGRNSIVTVVTKQSDPAISHATTGGGLVHPVIAPSKPLTSYTQLRLIAHSSLPSEFRFVGAADVSGNSDDELVFVSGTRTTYRIYGADLSLIHEGSYAGVPGRLYLYGDLNGDGKVDIGSRREGIVGGLTAYTGDGRMLLDKPVVAAFDNVVDFEGWSGSDMLIATTTGNLLHPRGFYGYSAATDQLRYFAPTSGFIDRVVPFGGRLYPDFFTPDDASTITHPDGTSEIDGEIYMNVFDQNGNWLPISHALDISNPMGDAQYFTFDSNNDGRPELYVAVRKDPHYAVGMPQLFRVDADGTTHRVFSGPENQPGGPVASFVSDGKSYLIYEWDALRRLDVLNNGFRTIFSRSYSHALPGAFLDFDGRGSVEYAAPFGGAVEVRTLSDAPLANLRMPDDEAQSNQIVDLRHDGKQEILAQGNHSIALYGY